MCFSVSRQENGWKILILLSLSALAFLFLAAFGAATLLPLQSEAVLAGLLVLHRDHVVLLLGIATLGNVLGSLVNYVLGRMVERFAGRRWFPVDPARLDKARGWYQHYGRYSLLLSWMPVIGDPLTLVAGVLRENVWVFLGLVLVAKLGRYLAVAAITLSVF